MKDSAGHSLIRLPDDVGDLSWHSVVSQKSQEGLPVSAVVRLFIVNEVDIQQRIHLQGLLQNDAQGCDLIRARSLLSKACLLITEMRAYCVFYSVQQDEIKHLSRDGQQCDSSVVGAGTEVVFLEKLDEVTLFPLCWNFFFFPYLAEGRV
ncbi:hypothetical protein DPMN_106802 [Dreissena polymorpha]|uniref:Uncharacterized protein n=1 Tax=Dreissena polymorpha TaxID=45954 RepID=A0A9D4QJ86_DREPO|nr:hypothetical protein DPMN_106802 [Dreissena polymorpha]